MIKLEGWREKRREESGRHKSDGKRHELIEETKREGERIRYEITDKNRREDIKN